MKTYTFTLHLSESELTEDISDKLYEAGLDDALVSQSAGRLQIDVDREAASLQDAVRSAIRNVHESGAGVIVIDVSPAEAKQVSGL